MNTLILFVTTVLSLLLTFLLINHTVDYIIKAKAAKALIAHCALVLGFHRKQ